MRGFATKKNRIIKAKKIEAILKNYLKKEIRNLKILDIGSGSGIISNYFSRNNDVFCVDVEDQRLDKSRSTFKKVSSEKLPFDDNFFDVVISNLVIEHIKNQELHLKEIRRILKNGGVCYLAAPNRLFPIEPHHKTPIIHWLPNKYFLKLLKFFGKYKEDIFLPSYFELVEKIKKCFNHQEYTHLVLKNPRKYFLKKIPFERALQKFPAKLNFLAPTNIFILKKEKRK